MQISRKEKRVIIIVILIALFVTLILPILSHIHFLAINYAKFYTAFPLEKITAIEYELKFHHFSHSVLAFTGLPLVFSIPQVNSYESFLLEPYKSFGYSLIPFLALKWIPWISIPISYRYTRGIVKWRRILYVYLIAVYFGVLNMTMIFGGSSFDLFSLF
jgi:hypothetical protein